MKKQRFSPIRHPWLACFLQLREAILITDDSGFIIDVNPAFTALTGYSRSESLGRRPDFLKSGRQTPDFYARMWESLINNGYWQGEIWNRSKNGRFYAERLSITAIRDNQGITTHYAAIFHDITADKAAEKALRDQVNRDALTGLPNRNLFADRLQQGLAHANRHERKLAVCYLDLDSFKPINDRYGHAIGDKVLIETGTRLVSALRTGDTVARIGGDEFALIFPDLIDAHEPGALLERLSLRLSPNYRIGDLDLQITSSIGMALFPDDSENPEELLKIADQLMYRNKAQRPGLHQPHSHQPLYSGLSQRLLFAI
jgi:diguanylate cyclase (GGDEF)-like protein/PAS domain S-box-containing protein